MRKTDTIELLYVAGSSDRKGKRILVRDHGGVENIIWPGGPTEADVALLGITPEDRKHIEAFFTGAGSQAARWVGHR